MLIKQLLNRADSLIVICKLQLMPLLHDHAQFTNIDREKSVSSYVRRPNGTHTFTEYNAS